jgi:hypothetical protein
MMKDWEAYRPSVSKDCRLIFDLPGFTVREKVRGLGNAVPLPMGRALA